MGQDNAIYTLSIKISLSNKGQNKSKPHKYHEVLFLLFTHKEGVKSVQFNVHIQRRLL